MPKIGCDNPLRGAGLEESVWCVEWTYASGAPVYDKTQSNQDPNILASSVITDTGAGIVTVKIPKSKKIRVIGKNLLPATATTGTQYRFHEVTTAAANSSTVVVRFFDTTFAAADPVDGSRYQLILLLE